MAPIKVLLVDDHSLVREGVRMLLENDAGIEVVGDAGGIDEAIELIARTRPDIILLDLNLGTESSLDHLERIAAASPASRILILTGLVDAEANRRVVAGGGQGIVLKNHAGGTLLTAIKKVHKGEVWFDRAFMAKLLSESKARGKVKTDGDRLVNSLTTREREIVKLIAEGLVNKDIALRLYVTEKTIRNALTVIYHKLGVTNRLELALFASRNSREAE